MVEHAKGNAIVRMLNDSSPAHSHFHHPKIMSANSSCDTQHHKSCFLSSDLYALYAALCVANHLGHPEMSPILRDLIKGAVHPRITGNQQPIITQCERWTHLSMSTFSTFRRHCRVGAPMLVHRLFFGWEMCTCNDVWSGK